MDNVSRDFAKSKTLADRGEAGVDWLADLTEMTAPVVKLLLMAGTCSLNWWAGKALSDGGLMMPAIFVSCDLAGFYFIQRYRSLSGSASSLCCLMALMLVFGSIVTALTFTFYHDAKAKVASDPLYTSELKAQMESARSEMISMQDNSLEKTIAAASLENIRDKYLKQIGKAQALDYNPVHAFFYAMPRIKENPDFWMAATRAYFTVCFTASAFLLPFVAGGPGRRHRLDQKPRPACSANDTDDEPRDPEAFSAAVAAKNTNQLSDHKR